jgi:hypothetical protein
MLYREIIVVFSEIHTKHINTLCGLNVELLCVKPGGTTGRERVNVCLAGLVVGCFTCTRKVSGLDLY